MIRPAPIMSEPTVAELQQAEPKSSKDERHQKKKSKSKPTEIEAIENLDANIKTPKKRKRDELPSEIEIDVSAPEPASKKAARKAKKAKTTSTSRATGSTAADGTPKESSGTDAGDGNEHTEKRSEYGVWVGNLPWSATKETLRTFLTEESEIKDADITRVHMPPPKTAPRPEWRGAKPQNRGFAYVDFSTQLAMYSAIALTETKMDGRPLLIKNAKNFEGRPDKPQAEADMLYPKGKGGERTAKAPSKKVFVGNLAFETSKEDLLEHFGQCGVVEDVHMATFEDSGKSKGFAWVTFEDVKAATSAVNGWVYKFVDSGKKKAEGDSEDDEIRNKGKKRKWKLNRLMGRDLRCEFAEDSTTRYQKRFGKEPREESKDFAGDDANVHPQRKGRPFAAAGKPSGRPYQPRGKVDPRTIRPGAAHANAPRASAAIVQHTGKKTTFT
jgi:RNA recognition motif-containing protein